MVMIGKQELAPTEEVFPELTRDVIDRMSSAKSARLKEVMEIVVRHLHGIVREAKLTQGEWSQAIDFLTHAGKMRKDAPSQEPKPSGATKHPAAGSAPS